MLSKYNYVAKAMSVASGFICVINAIIVLFTKTLIPALGPFSMGIFLCCIGIMELNNYEITKDKLSQILGWTYMAIFIFSLYLGIMQINVYVL